MGFQVVRSQLFRAEVIEHRLKCKGVPQNNVSQDNDNPSANQKVQQIATQWTEIIGTLFDKLTGKGATVTYSFDNLVIDIPKAQGPNGKDWGSAQLTIKGKIIISAEAHEADQANLGKRANQKSSVSRVA
jgi:hypothetical protein